MQLRGTKSCSDSAVQDPEDQGAEVGLSLSARGAGDICAALRCFGGLRCVRCALFSARRGEPWPAGFWGLHSASMLYHSARPASRGRGRGVHSAWMATRREIGYGIVLCYMRRDVAFDVHSSYDDAGELASRRTNQRIPHLCLCYRAQSEMQAVGNSSNSLPPQKTTIPRCSKYRLGAASMAWARRFWMPHHST